MNKKEEREFRKYLDAHVVKVNPKRYGAPLLRRIWTELLETPMDHVWKKFLPHCFMKIIDRQQFKGYKNEKFEPRDRFFKDFRYLSVLSNMEEKANNVEDLRKYRKARYKVVRRRKKQRGDHSKTIFL